MAKPGPKSVDEASRGSSPAGNSGGGPGGSYAQKAIPGPEHTGLPISMKRALAKKQGRGGDATGYAGSLKPAVRPR